MSASATDRQTLAEQWSEWLSGLGIAELPGPAITTAKRLLLDISGLCLAAREQDYIQAVIASLDSDNLGNNTLIGHSCTVSAADSALVNGIAAHGEDYDDTFEGTPVHAGAVVVPAVLAACERYERSGSDALRGIIAGSELMCRMARVTPMAIHRAGFHPTAVIGALGAAAGTGVALKLSSAQLTQALGIAASMASGIIEYLAEGTWTKRLHAGWAAQSGLRAVRLAQSGFTGPRTVFEGRHGFFHAFTNADTTPDFAVLNHQLGVSWSMPKIAFKPYACGTMTQPFIDCAITLNRQKIRSEEIRSIRCRVGEGTVHRLWEPLAEKHRPSTAYSAKFSVPFCIAVAIIDGAAGLAQFTPQRVGDESVLALAARIHYAIDPDNAYPDNYSGHLEVHLHSGDTLTIEQPHLRGGVREALCDHELTAKFRANARYGGYCEDQIQSMQTALTSFYDSARAGFGLRLLGAPRT